MKKVLLIVLILSIPVMCFAQFKDQAKLPAFSQVLANPGNGYILGFINPEKFSMHHSFSMNYMTMGNGQGMMVNSYLNTMDYQISNPLFLRLNLGIMNSPYNSFVNNPAVNNTKFFGGAELMYRPTENTSIKLGVDVRPGYYGPSYYNNYYGW